MQASKFESTASGGGSFGFQLPSQARVVTQPLQNITEARSAERVELLHLSKHNVQKPATGVHFK